MPEATIEFGSLALIPPEGGSWGEWVIARGIAEAGREERPIDHRTAYYIARFLSTASTSALRKLVRTGEIDYEGMLQEITGLYGGQPNLVQSWTAGLAHYLAHHSSRGPVEGWRRDISEQDRSNAEWLRREQVFASLDELFQQVPQVQRIPNAGKAGWHGLVRHEGRAGGWIVSDELPDGRRVWETDSDTELDERYVAIVEAQRQWVVDTFGGTMQGGYERIRNVDREETSDDPADSPHDPPP